MRLVVFCEAPADFRTASALVDRVLHAEGPAWVADLVHLHPEAIREWANDGRGNAFFDLHELDDYRRQFKIRFPQGHFNGEPGQAGAQMARNAFYIVREAGKRHLSPGVDAVFIVWDMDDQGELRRRGLKQARDEALQWMPFRVVLGCADPMREAWVLAGYEPESDEEQARLDEARRDLGFCPCQEAHLLHAKDEQAKRSPKRVVRLLTGDDATREARCSTETPLGRLMERGAGSGLREFLLEVKERVVPLCGGQKPQPQEARAVTSIGSS